MSNININTIDEYLIGNPQITYFKSIYRRHTMFMKYTDVISSEQDSNLLNPIDTITYDIPNSKYDLISDIYLQHQLIEVSGLLYSNIGNNLINKITFSNMSGNFKLETTGLIMEMMSELENPYVPSFSGSMCPPYMSLNQSGSLTVNKGNIYNITCFAGGVSGSDVTSSKTSEIFFTKPNFYFCKYYDKSFPLCAVNNQNLEFKVEYNPINKIGGPGLSGYLKRNVVIEGISLSTDEKRRIINNTNYEYYYEIENIEVPVGVGAATISIPSAAPVRTVYIIGAPPTAVYSASKSCSTPTELADNFKIVEINNGILIMENIERDIITKHNILKYYGEKAFGGRELVRINDTSRDHVGSLNSIGIISYGLNDSEIPNGHSNSGNEITIKVSNNNVKIFVEKINMYRIISGQIMSTITT